jgi:single-strand DNA-binding protein
MNVFTFFGNVARVEDVRQANGASVLNFVVANNVGFGNNKETLWVEVALFGKRAETLGDLLQKGTAVVVSGEAKLRSFQGKNGQQTVISVRANDVTLAGGRPQQAAPQREEPRPQRRPAPPVDDMDSDEIPF